ncbi:DUF6361 family protein [Mesorhizobium sp. M0006]|uniref:DUF6361 family protein n=1 Tax=Mesorhizobium sp. M0006 TaxID=2956838 RepID=UPI00333B0ACF
MTYLSKEALRDARRFMSADQTGVRDEIGFLIVHQRYADRFFPGTSVLHTRLRYILFMPWLYADVRATRSRGQKPVDLIAKAEHRLTERLLGEDGVIGGRVWPTPIDQPPSYVYWTALQRWGLLRERGLRGSWSRAQVERLVATPPTTSLRDDEEQPFEQATWPFTGCLDPPDDWRGTDKLVFKLSKHERTYLAAQLRGVKSTVGTNERSLLAMLVGQPLGDADQAWSPQILALARQERDSLVRAGQAAALAAIGRAVYAAQVETLKADLDKRGCSDAQRSALPKIVRNWGRRAQTLDWNAFLIDMENLPTLVSDALAQTLLWVLDGRADPMEIEPVYRRAEEWRKRRRARLSRTQDGADRRLEWNNEEHGPAMPLHYRWQNVKRLLADLEGVK